MWAYVARRVARCRVMWVEWGCWRLRGVGVLIRIRVGRLAVGRDRSVLRMQRHRRTGGNRMGVMARSGGHPRVVRLSWVGAHHRLLKKQMLEF